MKFLWMIRRLNLLLRTNTMRVTRSKFSNTTLSKQILPVSTPNYSFTNKACEIPPVNLHTTQFRLFSTNNKPESPEPNSWEDLKKDVDKAAREEINQATRPLFLLIRPVVRDTIRSKYFRYLLIAGGLGLLYYQYKQHEDPINALLPNIFPEPISNVTQKRYYEILRTDRIEQIEQAFAQTDRQVVLLAGLGGTGKTLLSQQYARDYLAHRSRLQSCVCWTFAADTEQAFRQSICRYLDINHIFYSENETVTQLWPRLLNHVKQQTQTLIIFDNAEPQTKELAIADYVMDVLQQVKSVRVLITARNPMAIARMNASCEHIDLTAGLNMTQAQEMMSRLCPRLLDTEAESALQALLLERLGGYPLGIYQVGTYLKEHPTLSLSDYQRCLDRYPELQFEFEEKSFLSRDYPRSYAQVIQLSMASLSKPARDLLSILAYLGPGLIPVELIQHMVQQIDVVDKHEDEIQQLKQQHLLEDLCRCGLLSQEVRDYQMHRVCQQVVRILTDAKATDEKAKVTDGARYQALLLTIHDGLVKTYDDYTDDLKAGQKKQQHILLAHFEVWWQHVQQHNLAKTDNYVEGMMRLADLWRERALFTMSLALYEQAFIIYQKKYGKRHPSIAKTLHCKAMIYQARGQLGQALQVYERALKMRERLYGETHPDIAETLDCKANVYYIQDELKQALQLYEKVLTMKQELYGMTHPSIAMTLNSMANVYYAQGKLTQALQLYKKTLIMKQQFYGAENPEIARTLHSIANIHQTRGELKQALQLYKKALVMYQQFYGEAHILVANVLHNMAGAHKKQNKLRQALQRYEQALKMYRQFYDKTHPHIAETLHSMAMVHQARGESEHALQLYGEALVMYQQFYGETHSAIAMTLHNMALIHQNQGELEQALKLYERALIMKQHCYGEVHPSIANTFNNMANVYKKQGELNKARDLYQQALAIYKLFYNAQHPEIKKTLHNIDMINRSPFTFKLKLSQILNFSEQRFAMSVRAIHPDEKNTVSVDNAQTSVAQNESDTKADKSSSQYGI